MLSLNILYSNNIDDQLENSLNQSFPPSIPTFNEMNNNIFCFHNPQLESYNQQINPNNLMNIFITDNNNNNIGLNDENSKDIINIVNENTNSKTFLGKKTNNNIIKFKTIKIIPKKNSLNNNNYERLNSPKNMKNNSFEKEVYFIEISNENSENNENRENNENKENNEYNNQVQKKQYGRKSRDIKLMGVKGNHTKIDNDNMIRKIKSFFGKSLYKYLNRSFIGEEQLLKLNIDINRRLKQDFNVKLFDMKLKDIYLESDISDKYKYKTKEDNIKLINKIYKEQKEIEVITILNLTYYEAFKIFIRNIDSDKFDNNLEEKIKGTQILNNKKFEDITVLFNNIDKNGKDNGEKKKDIDDYKNKIRELCLNFKKWFEDKVGRERD